MTTWADFAVVAALLLMPLAAAREPWSGPVDFYFLPNKVGRLFWAILLIMFVGGLWFQDYPHSADTSGPFEFGQVFTAFTRVFDLR